MPQKLKEERRKEKEKNNKEKKVHIIYIHVYIYIRVHPCVFAYHEYFLCVLVTNVIYVLNVVDLLMYNCIYNERIYICLLHVYRESFPPIMYYKINL